MAVLAMALPEIGLRQRWRESKLIAREIQEAQWLLSIAFGQKAFAAGISGNSSNAMHGWSVCFSASSSWSADSKWPARMLRRACRGHS
jgi:hypothetical protein